jgi:hypothetical protein
LTFAGNIIEIGTVTSGWRHWRRIAAGRCPLRRDGEPPLQGGELITVKSASNMTKRLTFAGSLRESRRALAISAFLCFADRIPWMLRSAHHWGV